MHLLEWNEDLSVGIASIDEEHKLFITHFNRLYEAIQFGHAQEILATIFDELRTYSLAHFAHEEKLMEETGFPDIESHKKAHEALRVRLNELQEKGRTTGYSLHLSNEVFAFMKDWLVHHTLTVDKRFTAHFKANGIT